MRRPAPARTGVYGLLLLALLSAGCATPLHRPEPTPLVVVVTATPAPPSPSAAAPTLTPRPEPTPAAPPTQVSGPSPRPAGAMVVHVRAGNLWAYDGRTSWSLSEDGRIYEPLLSPDGRRVLFRRHEKATDLSYEPFSMALLDLQTGRETPVDLSVLPTYPFEWEGRHVSLPRWPAVVAWMPDSRSLLFNTRVDFSMIGPGGAPGDDLWQVDAGSGRVRNLFPESEPPASFVVGPDGTRVLVNRPTRIESLDLSTGQRRTLLEFPMVLTYSEYNWLPEPHWLPDGRTALVAIAPADPMQSALFSLWQIDVEEGRARQLGVVSGSVFAWSPDGRSWSPDGAHLAYVTSVAGQTQVLLADAGGKDARPVAEGEHPRILGWSPDGRVVLFQDQGVLYAVAAGTEPRLNPLGTVGATAVRLLWLGEEALVSTEDGRLFRVLAGWSGLREIP